MSRAMERDMKGPTRERDLKQPAREARRDAKAKKLARWKMLHPMKAAALAREQGRSATQLEHQMSKENKRKRKASARRAQERSAKKPPRMARADRAALRRAM